MNERSYRGRALPATVVNRRIIGKPDRVLDVLANARRTGILASTPVASRLDDGRVVLEMKVLEPRKVRRFSRRAVWYVLLGTAAGGAAGMVVWLAVTWVLAHLLILGAAALLLLLLSVGTARSGVACRGLHCPGCRH